MSNEKKDALRVDIAQEDPNLSSPELKNEPNLEKSEYEDDTGSVELNNKEENGKSTPKYEFGLKNNKDNANEYDLIRFYLHEIADHALLSREEEIRIAKKIETGKRIIARTILSSSLMLNEICGIGEELQKGHLDIRDITNSLDEADNLAEDA